MNESVFDSTTVSVRIEENKDALGKLLGCVFFFYYLDEFVGDVWLIRIGLKSYESHATINEERYRGRGLGVFMYGVVADWLLERELVLKSTPITNQTLAARRLWHSRRLQSKFQIRKRGNRWVLTSASLKRVVVRAVKKRRTSPRTSSRAHVAVRR